MIGIQEMASKLNLTISSSDSLIEQASHHHQQLPPPTKINTSTLITSTEEDNILNEFQNKTDGYNYNSRTKDDKKVHSISNRNDVAPDMTVNKQSVISTDTAIISMSPGSTKDDIIQKSKLAKIEDHLSSITVSTADLSDTDMHVLTQDSFRSGIDASDQPGIMERCVDNTIPRDGTSGF